MQLQRQAKHERNVLLQDDADGLIAAFGKEATTLSGTSIVSSDPFYLATASKSNIVDNKY